MLVIAACKSGTNADRAPSVTDARGPTLRIVVDGKPAAEVPVASLASRPTVASLIDTPVAQWRQLEARGEAGPTMYATRYGEVYADQDAILYVDHGRAAIGMFRRVPADASETIRALALNPTNSLVGITEVGIRTEGAVLPAAPTTQIVLRAGDRTCTVDDAALVKLTPVVRGRDSKDRASWDVVELSRHCFGAAPTGVHVPGLDVDAATLARADRKVIVKVNRRGILKVRLVEPVAGGRPKVLTETTPTTIDVSL